MRAGSKCGADYFAIPVAVRIVVTIIVVTTGGARHLSGRIIVVGRIATWLIRNGVDAIAAGVFLRIARVTLRGAIGRANAQRRQRSPGSGGGLLEFLGQPYKLFHKGIEQVGGNLRRILEHEVNDS